MTTAIRGAFLAVLLMVGSGIGSRAQPQGEHRKGEPAPFCTDAARQTESFDARGLKVVYCATNPVLVRPLRAAHASARPVFYGAVPVAWGTAFLREGRQFADAYRLTLTQGVAYGIAYGLKRAVGRPRPYVTRAVSPRSSRHSAPARDQYLSFPSGHATLSVALVTSWGLSHPRWYVIGPGAVWAVAVSLSRIHLGVHYPSDVVAGTALGFGVGVLIHEIRGHLTPTRIRAESSQASFALPPISIRVRF